MSATLRMIQDRNGISSRLERQQFGLIKLGIFEIFWIQLIIIYSIRKIEKGGIFHDIIQFIGTLCLNIFSYFFMTMIHFMICISDISNSLLYLNVVISSKFFNCNFGISNVRLYIFFGIGIWQKLRSWFFISLKIEGKKF